MADYVRQKQDKNNKPLTSITKPLHLYFESELNTLHKHFTEKGDTAGIALLEPELHQRRMETVRVQELMPKEAPKLTEYQEKYFNAINKKQENHV